jgi:hypothetical protein
MLLRVVRVVFIVAVIVLVRIVEIHVIYLCNSICFDLINYKLTATATVFILALGYYFIINML